jgi:hypothetical protein
MAFQCDGWAEWIIVTWGGWLWGYDMYCGI